MVVYYCSLKVVLLLLVSTSVLVHGFSSSTRSQHHPGFGGHPHVGVGGGRTVVRPCTLSVRTQALQLPGCRVVMQDLKERSATTAAGTTSTSLQASNTRGGDKYSIKLPLVDKRTSKQLLSAGVFIVLDVLFRRVFTHFQLTFPSSLGGCAALFVTLLLLSQLNNKSSPADSLFDKLEPGASLLAKWLPVFFVPSLITLPLAMNEDTGLSSSALELIKVGIIIVGGFLFTLSTTAYSVVAVRKVCRRDGGSSDDSSSSSLSSSSRVSDKEKEEDDEEEQEEEDPVRAMSIRAVKYAERNRVMNVVFTRTLFRRLAGLSAVTGILAAGTMAATAATASTTTSTPTVLLQLLRVLQNSLTSIFLLSMTLTSFVFGSRLPKRFTKIVHPLVTCTGLTWTAALGLATVACRTAAAKSTVAKAAAKATAKASASAVAASSSSASISVVFRSILKSYYPRGHHPMMVGNIVIPAAGDILVFLLGPAVVSLAISMYGRRKLMRDNLAEVATAVLVSTVGGLFGTALCVRLLDIANPFLRLSLLSRNITSPLAMAIANILGADVSLAVTMVVVTGLIGANFGASLLDNVFAIRDPVARGLGIGAAAHGLGTAAFANEKDAFPFAAISMALTASAAVVAVSIPVVRKILIQLALGA